MDSAQKVDQAAKATSQIRTLVHTARTKLDTCFVGDNVFDVLIEPAAVEAQLRETFETIAHAHALLVNTTWPDEEDYKEAARRDD